MSIYGGPAIVTDSLGMNLDAANRKSYNANLQNLTVEYLIIAGGGGGGGVIGGGGGAGGLLYGTKTISTSSYSIVVGAGGSGGTGWNTASQDGKVGSNSSGLEITSNGGGGGRHYGGSTASTTVNGGSGGGGANGGANGGTGISGQGNNGGNLGTSNVGGGGGGAGAVGGNGNESLSRGGNGGIGKYFGDIFGNSVGFNGWFSDGGGGGVRANRTRGLGSNGAGDGGNYNGDTPSLTNAVINTGSGGGGAGYSATSNSIVGGNGGSGIVIIRYLGPQKASGGNTIFNYNGYTVHVFSSSGTFTVGEAWGDLTKNTFKTRLINGPTFNNINKGVIYFDGTNQYMNPPTSHSYLSSSSLALFFKAISVNVQSNSSTGRRATLIGYRHNEGYSQPTIGSLTLRSDNSGASYFLHASLITASQVYRSTSTSVNLNQWYYAVLVKDTVNGIMSIYVNGQFKNSVTFDAATYGQWTQAGQYIGANILDIGKSSGSSNQGWGNDYFNGYIGNIRLYTRVLNDNEIMKNFRALKGRYGL